MRLEQLYERHQSRLDDVTEKESQEEKAVRGRDGAFTEPAGRFDMNLHREVALSNNLDISCIEEVYPCTPMQSGLLSLAPRTSGDYIMNAVLALDPGLSLDAFRNAWATVVERMGILRTRFVHHSRLGILQVVLNETFSWDEGDDLETQLEKHKQLDLGFGKRLSHYSLVKGGNGTIWFIWTIHHALYDGWLLSQITQNVGCAYRGVACQKQPSFASFVEYTQRQDNDQALEYWRSAFMGFEGAPFPACLHTSVQLRAPQCAKTIIQPSPLSNQGNSFRDSTLINAAWALVSSRYTATDDVVFGTIVSGRSRHVPLTVDAAGPTIATVPLRIKIYDAEDVTTYLTAVETASVQRRGYEQIGLHKISGASANSEEACRFQTLLILHPRENDLQMDSDIGHWKTGSKDVVPHTYALTIQCFRTETALKLQANFDSEVLAPWTVKRMLGQFEWVLRQLVDAEPGSRVSEMEILHPADREQVWRWNATVPPRVDRCVHDLIAERARTQPEAAAVCAWDGNLTYRQLDDMATRLAMQLVDLGVGPESLVPLCFEKSMWTSVAVLAVLKAGGAFVLLDITQPAARLAAVVAQIEPHIMLVSTSYTTVDVRSDCIVRSIGHGSSVFDDHQRPASWLKQVCPTSDAYVIFTSGSTGKPKGVRVQHHALSSSCCYHGAKIGFSVNSRVFQFASYSFDAAIMELVTTLVHGGCICVPLAAERMSQLGESMARLKVNTAFLTPSVSRIVEPGKTSLETILIGGEISREEDFKRWSHLRKVIHVYGPTECTIFSCLNPQGSDSLYKNCIGWAIGSVNWIVDSRDHQRLAPLGAVGELLIEGPIVGRGYLNDQVRTTEVFMEDPVWLTQGGGPGHAGRRGRLYKTGDLVRYNEDGSLTYIGRKDNQVKIRGQRVELGDVEHHLRESLPEVRQVAAEVVECTGDDARPTLVAFLEGVEGGERGKGGEGVDMAPAEEEVLEAAGLSARVYRASAAAEERLREQLPAYMVPTIYFALRRLPITPSGKTDRKQLRSFAGSFSAPELAAMRSTLAGSERLPSTKVERILQQLWARVLSIDAGQIGLDDNFFHLGGDSIAAMKLAGEAQIAGIALSVADIFRYPKLELAAKLGLTDGETANEDVAAFSLLGGAADSAACCEQIAETYHLDVRSIEDAYPCTPLQEGLVALSLKSPGDYILRDVLELSPSVDVDRFRTAWEQVVQATPVLRTTIVQHGDLGLLQVVLAGCIRWTEGDDLELYLKQDLALRMELGQQLAHYGLICESVTGRAWFVWTLHHALYDGVSLPLMIDHVSKAYNGTGLGSHPEFRHFVKYTKDQDMNAAEAYWRGVFKGYDAATFPPLPPSRREPVPDSEIIHQCSLGSATRSGATLANILRAAWALVMWQYSGSTDVTFGAIVSGRSAAVAGIERILGPTIATVPVRIQITAEETLGAFVARVQEQAAGMIPYEQTGLRRISTVSESAERACGFQTLLVLQAPKREPATDRSLGSWQSRSHAQAFTTYALTITCQLGGDGEGVAVQANFDSKVLAPWMVKRMLSQFAWVLQQLVDAEPGSRVSEMEILHPADREQVWRWNATVPPRVDRCVHDLIAERARTQPEAAAVCAWDGNLTYRQLDDMATRLAMRLVDLGVGPEALVPLCFEKSMWTSVAVLAVLKAGGAFVLLDITQPAARLAAVVAQIEPHIMLVSTSYTTVDVRSDCIVRSIGHGSSVFDDHQRPASWLKQVRPTSDAYVIFTSGSTGKPKGVRVQHHALSSSCCYHGAKIGFSVNSRVFQFASYSFDAAIMELVTTLVHGGCICVPSAEERMSQLGESMARLKVNTAFLTPSVSRIVEPGKTSLETILIGGEISREEDFKRWSHLRKVIHVYGPTECTIFSCLNPQSSDSLYKNCIGWAIGSVNWIVDSRDHQRLAPLGAVGELLIEGPIVGRGYLNDQVRTTEVFMEDPVWLTQGGGPGHAGRRGRLYKTGDLVQYNEDGSLTYIGRKDTQVKIRGQRVELGDVEHHLRESFPEVRQVAAEVVECAGDDARPTLVAFLEGVDMAPAEQKVLEAAGLSARVYSPSVAAEDKLRERLPAYMVPTIYFALRRLPITPSGKTDRKQLRSFAGSFSAPELAAMHGTTAGSKRLPSTKAEHTLQQLWARVLSIDAGQIGLDDNFFHLGGDSIVAMELAGESRTAGMGLSVADIFRYPKLELAAMLGLTDEETADGETVNEDVAAFSLIDRAVDFTACCKQIAETYHLDVASIEDAYPCTPLQEGLVALSLKSPGDYILRDVLELSPSVDVDRFRTAWEQVVQTTPVLRATIVQHSDFGLLQVVLAGCIRWTEGDDLELYLKQDLALRMELGQPLARYGLICESVTGRAWFVWTLHHALYDGVSLPLMLDHVTKTYHGTGLGANPGFKHFVKYIKDQDMNAAEAYWRGVFEGYDAATFPPLPPSRQEPVPDSEIIHQCPLGSATKSGVTQANILRAAWALVMWQYSGSTDVIFGAIVSGRSAAVAGIERILGPTIATVPVRIQVTAEETLEAFVLKVQGQAAGMIPYEQTGLRRISAVSESANRACGFQTLLVLQAPKREPATDRSLGSWQSRSHAQAFTTYALTITCQLGGDGEGVAVQANFDSKVLAPWMVKRMLGQFAWVLRQLVEAEPGSRVSEIGILHPADREQVWRWNATVPPRVDRCVHDLIAERARTQPEAAAVCAWDGNLTYGQLDDMATRLAMRLVELGVRPEGLVPLCFEKSMWTSVAVLAVLKAGGAFVLLDITQPAARLAAVVAQTGANLMLSSVAAYPLTISLVLEVIVVGSGTVSLQESIEQNRLPCVDPSAALYAVFTSGSTGTPKGVLISHSNYSSALFYQSDHLAFQKSSRVFDFSSYSFDVAIENTFMTLTTGGCLCVPSEISRKDDLLSSIRSMNPTLIELTPSVCKILGGPCLDSIQTLVVGGESLHADDVAQWPPSVHVINTYGPSECTATSTINVDVLRGVDGIGKGAGAVTWVVDADNYERLTAIGAVGELLIEGPIVGRGYLNDPVRTAEVFIEDPVWLTQGGPGHTGRRGRLYKTGDLVRYNEDGSLTYIGRKDTQVKIRGQRVELGEVEHHLRESLPEVRQVAAEVVECAGDDARPTLVAFLDGVEMAPAKQDVLEAVGLSARVYRASVAAEDRLRERLPAYMVPTVYFTLGRLPITPSGKTDRKQLRSFAGSFSAPELAAMHSTTAGSKPLPSTKAERILQQLWARVLSIDAGQIGLDDNFFHLGGDSIAAMKMAGESRTTGMALSVADIFRYPKLELLAKLGLTDGETANEDVVAFSLLGGATDSTACCKQIAETFELDVACIEDAYPCTPLQEGLVALSLKSPGNYILRDVLELSPSVDVDRFRTAWEQVVQATSVLRTTIVQHGDLGLLQVVLAGDVRWTEGDDLELYLKQDLTLRMEPGQPLARYGLIREAVTGRAWFVWTLHHALYDGVSLPLMLDHVSKAYRGTGLGSHPEFRHFVKYIKDQDMNAAQVYWRGVFEGYDSPTFPPLPPSRREPVPDSEVVHQCPLGSATKSGVTQASILRAAWALVMWQYSGSRDVTFGAIVSGRSAPIGGIAQMVGPTIATVPVRIQFAAEETLRAFVLKVQEQATEMIPYEQTGLRRISAVSESANRACGFQTLLVLQAPKREPATDRSLGSWQSRSHAQAFTTYALTITCQLGGDGEGVAVQANFDSKVLAPWMVKRMLGQFTWVLRQLVEAEPGLRVSEMEILHPADQEQVWRWNATVPPRVDRCVHDLITERARTQPEAAAVCAWDGNLTYRQLDDMATRLAMRLVDLGVGPETLVPLCFEKSMWTSVAVLAVLKAGGAFVLLDITQPAARLAAVVAQTGADVILSSVSAHPLSLSLVSEVIAVGSGTASLQEHIKRARLPCVNPSVALYAVFTSGSTGTPKGVLISHSSFSSALFYQSTRLGFQKSSRVFDFSSYSFDMAIENAFMTLTTGGCLCVPSETSRQDDLLSSIRLMTPDLMVLTPSVCKILSGPCLGSVKTLVVGGESLHADDVAQWPPSVHVINTYGPAECTAVTTINVDVLRGVDGIGKGAGAVTWVADADNYERLTPIGAVGELLIEGPIVGRGYLNDPVRTAEVFIEDPVWLTQGGPGHTGRRGRLYKTGDLVRYNEDGSLTYIGRKDTQVKIRGQRVELGEVEHHLRESLPEVRQVAAEVVECAGDHSRPILVAFLEGIEGVHMTPVKQEVMQATGLSAQVYDPPSVAEERLRERLPAYMVPTVYFAIGRLPIMPSGKTDRKQLRSFAGSFSAPELAAIHSTTAGSKRLPSTKAERILQQLWARVLSIDAGQIGLDDNFFHLGGDSIVAMKLVGEARAAGMALSVADIFRYPKLKLAAMLGLTDEETADGETVNEDVAAFGLIDRAADSAACCEQIAETYDLDVASIEDAYPCTPLQEGLVALSLKSSGDYILRDVLELSPSVDVDRFRTAWEQVVHATPVLRTTIVQHGDLGLLQVVLAGGVRWTEGDDLELYLKQDLTLRMELGQPLARYGLICESVTGRAWFVWTLHHALYDGLSLPLMLDHVSKAYHGTGLGAHPGFKHFVKYIKDQDMNAAEAYWRGVFEGYDSATFPPLPPSRQEPVPDSEIIHQCPLGSATKSGVTQASILRAAWALVMWQYSGSTDVTFGAIVSGRSAPIGGIAQMVGPTIATVPVRIQVAAAETSRAFVARVQEQAAEMLAYEQTGLRRISAVSESANRACSFQTLLVLQALQNEPATDRSLGLWQSRSHAQAFTTYALTITCQLGCDGEGVAVQANFDSEVLAPWIIKRMLSQFAWVLRQLVESDSGLGVSEIGILNPADQEQVWRWNATVPPRMDRCVHDLITERARTQPEAAAVCAWDGNLTYRQLDDMATRLAMRLIDLGVGPEALVPLCFEKSMWTSVAVLAVLKAGGAFVLLDITQPASRLAAVVAQTGADVILSSVAAHPLSLSLVSEVIAVGSRTLSPEGTIQRARLPCVNPSVALYAVFTSGSTGTPKGVLISHSSFSSALHHQLQSLSFSAKSRHFDFMSYTFDVAIHNTLATFVAGGCLCVPSEEARKNDLANTIIQFKSNSASLTPSVARLLNPERLASLKFLILIGEALTRDDAQAWRNIRLINGYGPAECTPYATVHHMFTSTASEVSIGKGVGAVTWVANADNCERLTPIGAVGELLIEGPIVGRGYLNDPVRTAEVFIEDPVWLTQGGGPGHTGRRGRLYKTGDLVRYNEDGSLTYIGRKDNQVKIRGQRVELGEVEHHLRESLPEVRQVAAEVVECAGDDARPTLVAFLDGVEGVEWGDGDDMAPAEQEVLEEAGLSARVYRLEAAAEDRLRERLPAYMVPTVYFALGRLPITPSGKTDRKQLRSFAGSFSAPELAAMHSTPAGSKRLPSTETERILHQLWARVLNIDAGKIGLDDNFFHLGGDSIVAMKLAGEARTAGMALSVADIFRYPKLELAAKLGLTDGETANEEIPAFSLLGGPVDSTACCRQIAETYGLDVASIEDAYPCTPLQEGLVALSLKSPGNYILRDVLELSPSVDVDRFRTAWGHIVQATPVLRTTIVQHGDLGLLQVVLAGGVRWTEGDDLELYLKEDLALRMEPGQSLARYGLIREAVTGRSWFVWTLHHALYDGVSLPLMLDHVSKAYHGTGLGSHPEFRHFVKYIKDQDMNAAEAYWRGVFEGYDSATFPPLPPSRQEPVPDSEIIHQCPLGSATKSGVTQASILRAAWALVMWQYSGSTDVTFGAIVSGRSAPIGGIAQILGPTIATVPVRIQVAAEETLGVFMARVHEQAAGMISYEQTGLRRISAVSESAERACGFQTLLVLQAPQNEPATDRSLGLWQSRSHAQAFTTYALTITCQLGRDGEGVAVQANFDSKVLAPWMVKRMLGQFAWVLQQLVETEPGSRVSELGMLHPADQEQVWRWNATVPPRVDRCVHDLITERARTQPEAAAVCAWDGNLTYRQLDDMATRLAMRLLDLGVGPETLVPLCFEKSMWTSVAVLAVLKAGGAFVLLDITQPVARLTAIVAQTGADVVLSSVSAHPLSLSLVSEVIAVGSGTVSLQESIERARLPCVNPSVALYAVFTSGSTGTPKGVLISHSSFSSALHHQLQSLSFSAKSRHFDFMSYTFDVAIHNTLATFVAGGCLCVPSEEARKNDLPNAIIQFKSNSASLTPSVARLLNPERLASLKFLILIGEALTRDDAQAWRNIRLINGYGPAECTPYATVHHIFTSTASEVSIGKGVGAVTWVADADNCERLTPIGAVGELLIEGPIVGRGYLNDPVRTAEVFIEDPVWLTQGGGPGHTGRRGRLYKTGDLVRYNEDGSLTYIGRKDTQVKIRGQRVELGEVEHHLRESLPEVRQVAAEVVECAGDDARPTLVAFLDGVEMAPAKQDMLEAVGLSARVYRPLAAAEDRLRERLPAYMVPTVYFALGRLPITPSGKTDRKQLRSFASSFSAPELAAIRNTPTGSKRLPSTKAERTLQQLWARVLNIDADRIGLDDNFFHLGGDSISGMHLVGLSRTQRLFLTLGEVFQYSRLQDLAAALRQDDSPVIVGQSPYSLVTDGDPAEFLRENVLPFLPPSTPSISDVLPVTDFQRHCVENELEPFSPTRHYFYLDYPPQTPDSALYSSCSMLSTRFDALRAIFFRSLSTMLQAMPVDLSLPVDYHETGDGSISTLFERVCTKDLSCALPLGQPFTRFLILRSQSAIRLVLRLSHAQYDGMSLAYIARALGEHYQGISQPPVQTFASYLHYCDANKKRRHDYWSSVLTDSQVTMLGERASCTSHSDDQIRLKGRVPALSSRFDVTPATIFTAACAAALAKATGRSDVVFGRLVSGRGGLPPAFQEIVGPCVNTVPVRAQFGDTVEMQDVLQMIQRQYVQATPYEAISLNELARHCTDWASGDIEWGLVSQYQNIDEKPIASLGTSEARLRCFEKAEKAIRTRTILIFALPDDESLRLSMTASSSYYDESQIVRLYDCLYNLLSMFGY